MCFLAYLFFLGNGYVAAQSQAESNNLILLKKNLVLLFYLLKY